MAILNYTGWEEGTNNNLGNGYMDTGSLAGTEATYDTGTVHAGSYSLKVAKVGTAIGSNIVGLAFGSDGRVDINSGSFANTYIQFYFRYSAKPASASEDIFAIDGDDGNEKMALRLDSAGKLSLYNSVPTQIGSTGATALTVNTWYQIRLKVGSGVLGAYELLINGVSELSGTVTLTNVNNTGKVSVGCRTNRNTVDYTAFWDDLVVSDSAFPSGACEVKVIKPTANGSTMSWANGTNASNYLEVDEIPRDDGTTDYVTSIGSSAPQVALFAMQDCATVGITGTILALKGRIVTRENASNTSATLIRVKSGSTNSDSGTLNGSTTLQGRQRLLETNPDTSTAWTTTTIDAVEIGAVENNNVAVRLTNVMAYILYIPSVSVNYPITMAQGSFTLTGQTTLLKLGRKMLASLGSFVLSGQDTTFSVHIRYVTMVASMGSFTLSGQSVILRYGRTMLASVGMFALTGQDILMHIGRKMTAVYGQFALTGQTVLLKVGKYMSASVGSFVLSGQSVLFHLAWKMSAVYTTFALTGQTVLLKVGRNIVASVGTFTLTGQAVLFHLAWKMRAVYGQFTLTGQNVLFAINGLYIRWTNAVKNTSTFQNIAKNVATWINRNKTL